MKKWAITLHTQDQYIEVTAPTEAEAVTKAYQEAEPPSWDATVEYEICQACEVELGEGDCEACMDTWRDG